MRLSDVVARTVAWAAGVFYELDVLGERVPDGPVLIVANHPNSLLDPLVVFHAAGRAARPLAKAPLFDQLIVGLALRGLGGLPVYRRQDDPALMHLNDGTFDAAVAALHAGDAVQIYPEGKSHSEPAMAPLRTGAARIALLAEERTGWSLGLRIVPLGLTYERKAFFRGRAVAVVGSAFTVADLRPLHAADPAAATRALTDRIAAALEVLTLNLAENRDRDLIDTAERIWSREKGLASWRERAALGERLPRLQQFAHALAWLRAHDTARHAGLARAVDAYRHTASRLGAGDADVPPRYAPGGVARYMARESLLLVLGLPLAAVGLVAWYPVYALPHVAVPRLRIPYEAIATYKLAIGMLAAPLFWILWTTLAGLVAGPAAALVTAIALPPLGLLALRWATRWERVQADARLFFRLLRRRDAQRQLADLRRQLVDEFDAVQRLLEEWRQEAPEAAR